MKRMRCFLCMALTAVSLLSLSVSASAADYSFETDGTPEYYPSTSYEEVYGSQYNYGGKNLVDYQVPELPYGTMSTTQTGVMEKILLPGLQASVSTSVQGGYGIVGDGLYVPSLPVVSGGIQYQTPAYTSADGMERKDGSIGTVKIPTLDISMKVWEGETTASMAKKVIGLVFREEEFEKQDGTVGVAVKAAWACDINKTAEQDIPKRRVLKTNNAPSAPRYVPNTLAPVNYAPNFTPVDGDDLPF